jgi:hypothetical protein
VLALLTRAASLAPTTVASVSCRSMSPTAGTERPPEQSVSARLADTSIVIPPAYARGNTSLRAAAVRLIAASGPAPVRLNPATLPASLDAGLSFPTTERRRYMSSNETLVVTANPGCVPQRALRQCEPHPRRHLARRTE